MIRAACALLLAAGWAAAADPGSHGAPAESLARQPAADDRRETLIDMWQRGILTTDMGAWSPEDMAVLLRIRKAEEAGAFGLLRRHFASQKGLVIRDRQPGSGTTRLRLTKAGFDRYLGLKSQEALQYFESREVATKWTYWLADLDGRPLFDRSSGLLTEAGDALYTRTLLGLPACWRTRSGQVMGNRPPAVCAALAAPRPTP